MSSLKKRLGSAGIFLISGQNRRDYHEHSSQAFTSTTMSQFFGLLMSKPYRFTAAILSCIIAYGCASSVMSQEKLRIDEQTATLVESPWELANVDTKSNFRGLTFTAPMTFG